LKNFDYNDDKLDSLSRGIDALAIDISLKISKQRFKTSCRISPRLKRWLEVTWTQGTLSNSKHKYLTMREELLDVIMIQTAQMSLNELANSEKGLIYFYLEQHNIPS
jgi:hypothetical protein